MPNCSICNRKLTSKRQLCSESLFNICVQCSTNINESNYVISNEKHEHAEKFGEFKHDDNINLRQSINDGEEGEDLIFIGVNNKSISITNDTEIHIEIQEADIDVTGNFKDALMASLYSQVEFLKNEIEEKNLVIRILLTENKETRKNSETPTQSSSRFNSTSEYNGDNDDTDHDISVNNITEINAINTIEVLEVNCRDESKEIENRRRIKIDNEIAEIRKMKHEEYIRLIEGYEDDNTSKKGLIDRGITPLLGYSKNVVNANKDHMWPPNTCLIVGDSILNNIDESKLSKKNKIVKVRPFSGSSIIDMYSYIVPLIQKRPSSIILHVGTNDAREKSADVLLDELLELKLFISKQLPDTKIIISQPTIRNDNFKAKETIRNLIDKINLLDIPTIDNRNIGLEQLGRKGLHLNKWGASRLAMNYISFIRTL